MTGQQGDDISVLNTTTSTTHDALFVNVVVDGVPRLFVTHIDLPASAWIHLHVRFLRTVGIHSIQLCGNFPGGGTDSPDPIVAIDVVGP